MYLIGQFSSKPVTGKRYLKMRVVLLNKNYQEFFEDSISYVQIEEFPQKEFPGTSWNGSSIK